MRVPTYLLTGFAAIAILVITASTACGGDDGDAAGLEARLDEIDTLLANIQLVTALDALDGTATHSYDEQTARASGLDDIPAGYVATVRKIRSVVQALEWPEDMQDEVQELVAQADNLEAALLGDDLGAMKEASPQFHAAWHAIRQVGYDKIGGQPPPAPGMESMSAHD